MLRDCYPRKLLAIFREVSLRTRLPTLQKLQNRAARIVTNSSCDAPANILIQKLTWPTISEIIKQETVTMV